MYYEPDKRRNKKREGFHTRQETRWWGGGPYGGAVEGGKACLLNPKKNLSLGYWDAFVPQKTREGGTAQWSGDAQRWFLKGMNA